MQRRILLGAALMTAALDALAFEKEADWTELEKPIEGAENALIKVFSYDCPFCYKFDQSVDPKIAPRAEKELGLAFMPMHLETKGKYGRAASEFFALCILRDRKAARRLDAPESLFRKAKEAAYFAYNKMEERWPQGEGAFIETLCKATGLDPSAVAAERKTPDVQALADSWKAGYPAAKRQGVPAYIVKGRYLILTKRIRSLDGMFDLIKELSQKA
ncbi:MAG: Thiol:disulfide interchange protein DsbA [Burkholderia sp.]|jgi:hypothetical protein